MNDASAKTDVADEKACVCNIRDADYNERSGVTGNGAAIDDGSCAVELDGNLPCVDAAENRSGLANR